jgi:GxxExxY protein
LEKEKLLFEDESYVILGACMEVYKELGSGFLELVYQEALAMEFKSRGIIYIEHPELKVYYKGNALNQIYKPDFICFDKIVIEIKAASKLSDEHRAQLHNYLKATGIKLGLLINFGQFPLIEKERIIR